MQTYIISNRSGKILSRFATRVFSTVHSIYRYELALKKSGDWVLTFYMQGNNNLDAYKKIAEEAERSGIA